MAKNVFKQLGKKVATLGGQLDLPEMHISEGLSKFGDLLGERDQPQFQAVAPYGLNPTADQQRQIASNPSLSSRSFASVGVPYGPEPAAMYGPEPAPADPFEDLLSQMMDQSGSGGSSGSSSGSSEGGNVAEFGGRFYDLSDPAQSMAYWQAANADNLFQADQQYQGALGTIGSSRSAVETNAQRALRELRERREQLKMERENYFSDLEKQGRDFVSGKSVGDAQRGNAFAQRGANAFQSSQASSQDFADQKFAEGLGELQKAGDQAKSQYDLQGSGLDASESDIQTKFQQDQADLERQAREAAAARENYINQSKSQLVGQLAPFDFARGVTDVAGRYGLQPYSPVSASRADLTGASQATNFQSVASAPQSQAGGKVLAASKGMAPLDNYFGYSPTPKDKDRLQNYFAGKV